MPGDYVVNDRGEYVPDVVRTVRDDQVALIEMNRPPANFFDLESLGLLADAILACDDEPDVRAIVLCAAGRHFCAGADLRGIDEDGIRRVYRQAYRIISGRKPVVAAVHGSAVDGGLGLAMAADFRVAAVDARLTANFARLGFHQGFGLSVTLPRAAGMQTAQDLLFTGRDVSGEEAVTLGLVDAVAASGDERQAAMALARRVAAAGPLGVASIRATMRRALLVEVAEALDDEAAAQGTLLGTADFAEGIASAVEKREPMFTGH